MEFVLKKINSIAHIATNTTSYFDDTAANNNITTTMQTSKKRKKRAKTTTNQQQQQQQYEELNLSCEISNILEKVVCGKVLTIITNIVVGELED